MTKPTKGPVVKITNGVWLRAGLVKSVVAQMVGDDPKQGGMVLIRTWEDTFRVPTKTYAEAILTANAIGEAFCHNPNQLS